MLSAYLAMISTQKDREKFERLFHQYERTLKYTAKTILWDEHLAEDAVQEAFIRIIDCLDKIDESEPGKTAGFLITIIKHIAYDIQRKQNKAQPSASLEELAELDAGPEDHQNRPDTLLLDQEEASQIVKAIHHLPSDYQYILSLKYVYNCNNRQIAALINCSEELARVKLSRARKSLMIRLNLIKGTAKE